MTDKQHIFPARDDGKDLKAYSKPVLTRGPVLSRITAEQGGASITDDSIQ